MTKLDKALQRINAVKRVLVENSCPSEFGLEDHCSEYPNCELCWGREVEE